MTSDDRAKLIAAWIEHHTREVVRDEQNVFRERKGQDNFWAFQEMDRLCRSEPELCWEFILQILQTPHHESVETALAAGPLEDLIAKHGDRFIERIEARAKTDAQFRDLLGGVWQNETPGELWTRVEAVRGEVW
jgi:hypothetical protein